MGWQGEGAAILQLTPDGRLPAGRHPATLDEMHDLFVAGAPHREARQFIFEAFKIHYSLVRQLFSRGTLWVDGGFCTHKPEAPKDIDMVIIVDPSEVQAFNSEKEERLLQLLTLQGVQVAQPGATTPRVQPMGGLIDCFFALSTDVDALKMWDLTWSGVKGTDGKIVPGLTKGYLEVTW
ncbi:DUF6932 family protein [Streptomyces sp. NPDC058274]|uniref:DUF6932 family protein n=1 Tax=Streptomyces sp. NPDC058274 TaxID=3346416 RepID=UPI0036EB185C